jgi:ketosteroid isomerase-like protein
VALQSKLLCAAYVDGGQMRRLLLRIVVALPGPLRRRVLVSAFRHAEDAFNRGDLDAVFASFADDVEYLPPAPLPRAAPIVGKARVLAFWEDVAARYESEIETNELRELGRGRMFRAARLRHVARDGDETIEYSIEQLTEIEGGQVVSQRNAVRA